MGNQLAKMFSVQDNRVNLEHVIDYYMSKVESNLRVQLQAEQNKMQEIQDSCQEADKRVADILADRDFSEKTFATMHAQKKALESHLSIFENQKVAVMVSDTVLCEEDGDYAVESHISIKVATSYSAATAPSHTVKIDPESNLGKAVTERDNLRSLHNAKVKEITKIRAALTQLPSVERYYRGQIGAAALSESEDGKALLDRLDQCETPLKLLGLSE